MSAAVLQATPETTTAAASASRRRFGALDVWQSVGPLAVFLALFALVAVTRPTFLGGGMGILAAQAAAILLVALGQACVLHVGSIDLSNAAMAVLAAMVLAMTLGPLGPLGIVVSVGVVTLIGALNGLLITYVQVPSFALTLGTLGILQSVSLVISDATTVYVTGNAQLLSPLFGTAIAKIPLAFWVAVILAAALFIVLRYTRTGQGLTAVGLNEKGAMFSGLPTRRLKVLAFALSGFFAGMAGVMIIGQAGAASSFGLGSDLLLPAIAAAIVGGTSITGGATNPILVVFGALTVGLIPIGAAAVGVPETAQSLVYGLVIIVAVALTIRRNGTGVIK